MKKICFLHTNADYLLGLRLSMLRAFVGQGCEVVAFAPDMSKDHSDRLAAFGIEGRRYSLEAAGFNPFLDILNSIRLMFVFRRIRPDIVFSNNAKPVVFGTIAAWLAGIRERYVLVGGLGFAFIDPPDGVAPGRRRLLSRGVLKILYWISFRLAKRVYFHNPDDRRLLESAGICPVGKSVVVPGSGVDVDEFAPAGHPASPVFVFVGRLIRDKGVVEYLSAARALKRIHGEARCLLVGGCDSNPAALDEAFIRQYSDCVEWFGQVSDVRPFLRMASVFVLPSYREGLPRSTLEAMASGLAIITADAPGCRETVAPGINGLLVGVGDEMALSKAMVDLYEDPARVRSMGRESRRIAVECFSVDHVNRLIIEDMHLEKGA